MPEACYMSVPAVIDDESRKKVSALLPPTALLKTRIIGISINKSRNQ
jgi:hypothetical protein